MQYVVYSNIRDQETRVFLNLSRLPRLLSLLDPLFSSISRMVGAYFKGIPPPQSGIPRLARTWIPQFRIEYRWQELSPNQRARREGKIMMPTACSVSVVSTALP
jgi:hypothetical protein